MNINILKAVYFIGAGGIGMSALVRYFLSKGKKVGLRYDRTPSELTEKLIAEGAAIHYEENVSAIPEDFLDPDKPLIVCTPAIPATHKEFCLFSGKRFQYKKVVNPSRSSLVQKEDYALPAHMARPQLLPWLLTCCISLTLDVMLS